MVKINRSEYLDWLIRWRGRQIIKVVSGVRRCGKSTMFDIFRSYLLNDGVRQEQITMLNFENIDYEDLTDYKKLYHYMNERLLPDQMNYILLDEIQHVTNFEKAVDSLFIKENCDVYITGSNAYFMSGELATLLSGRYVELKMLPLSFSEFCGALTETDLSMQQKFARYLEFSSFPYVTRLGLEQRDAKEYLMDIYHTVLLKDVVARLNRSDVTSLENVAKFMLHNIGNLVSPTKIANTLKSQGTKVDQKTVDKYLRGLTESLLLYEAGRYNIKGKQYLTQQSKYYAVDIGLRNVLVRGKDSDVGHILENIVYLELLRRGYRVYVGQMSDGEVDFVAISSEETIYYQVAATTLEESTLERELAPLRKIQDNYPKYLLTLDELFNNVDYEGIKKRNVLEWLLKKSE
ncbi:ATP-binding protein [Hungatella sp.]|uniref:ATP-binding protein n=1 Tax=Hungatella sp. TaxID=2613924 RepID=UPI002A830048|nr:ATP-binding protein [Hungatella sp.]